MQLLLKIAELETYGWCACRLDRQGGSLSSVVDLVVEESMVSDSLARTAYLVLRAKKPVSTDLLLHDS